MQGVVDVSGDRMAWATRWAEVQRLCIQYPAPPPGLTGMTAAIAGGSQPRLDLSELAQVQVNNTNGGSENELVLTFTTGAPLYFRINDLRERDCWLESLRVLCTSSRSPGMPLMIPQSSARACIGALQWLRVNPSSIEGPFRENGDKKHTLALWQVLAIQGMAAIPGSITVDGRIAADLVKGILRRLPESLLTNSLFPQFRAASSMNSRDQLISLTQRLPPTNQQLLFLLFQTLSSLVASPVSRLDANNLTTLISPCLLPEDDVTSLREIGKSSPLLFMFQTFIAQPQLLESKASSSGGSSPGVGLGLQPMAMSPLHAASGGTKPTLRTQSSGSGLGLDEKKPSMPPLMSPTSLASPLNPGGLVLAPTPSAAAASSMAFGGGTPGSVAGDMMSLTLPVDAEKSVKLMKRGTKQIIIAHQYEWVRVCVLLAFCLIILHCMIFPFLQCNRMKNLRRLRPS
jgi:hypothetical protein